jgi:hypothetical protein
MTYQQFITCFLLISICAVPATVFTREARYPVDPGDMCLTMRLQEQYGKYIPDSGTRSLELPCDHTPVGPPHDVQIGSQWEWYIWRLNGYPEADLKTCTVRGSSDHAWLVVEDSQWNVNIDQSDVDIILDYFENTSIGQFPEQGIWDLNTSHFGMPPDHLDQDGKIYILYYDFDVSADGYFWSFDQGCDGTAAFASNECDVVYLNCSDYSPSGDYMVAVLAHEFEHMIHYEQDINEAAWVDEGCAELAMWLFGNPDTISMFNTNPDNNLTIWNGVWADYIKTYLWMLYFYEQFGGQPAIMDLVSESANSINGFNNFFARNGYPETFDQYFANWTVANFLDEPGFEDGQFGYASDTLPPFSVTATHATYPVQEPATVNHWAADYVRFTATHPLRFTFEGDPSTEFAVWVLEIKPDYWPRVTRMNLDTSQQGELVLSDFGSLFTEAILVIAGISSNGGVSYNYAAFEEADPDTPTPVPTHTPAATGTPAATATPAWYGNDPAMRFLLNQTEFYGGDDFILDAEFWNPDPAPLHVDAFIVLAVAGNYWFWPTWIHVDDGVDFKDLVLPAEIVSAQSILAFTWPEGTGSAENLCFLGAIIDHETGFWYGGVIAETCFDYR